MDIIHLLPDSVANQIAAGEVIQRPASCLKELVENSLDAGASTVQILLYDAGRTMMQVTDDGNGMSETDARMAFERHATSKIRTADDLFSLHTMGFRGEALASICAVAQVEVMTRREDDETGTRLQINGSEVIEQEPCSCAKGTTIKVKNLFYNVPARRRFLKTDGTELRNILHEFYRIVLVNPQCHFLLAHQDEILFDLPACNTKTRIEQVFGKGHNKQFTAGLVEVKSETELVSVYGFVGKPEISAKQAQQYFFVNNRYMRHPYFHKAVLTAYQGMLQPDMQPPYFIYFDIRPDAIDVNIHPTKTEIKFENEQAIWQILSAAVKDAVGKFNDIPSIEFDTEGRPDIPLFGSGGDATVPQVKVNPQYNPFRKGEPQHGRQPVDGDWQQLYEAAAHKDDQQTTLFDEQDGSAADDVMAEKSPIHYQYKGRFIMTAVKSGLMIVDQHRAHLRVLFEEYLQKMDSHRWPTQSVLFPEIIRLTPTETAVMQQVLGQLEEVGFAVSDLGGGSFSINGVPAGLDGVDPKNMLNELLTSAREKTGRPKSEMGESLALGMARSSAIPYGQVLSNEEMENLVNRLFACSNAKMTPDGKLITCILKQDEIERLLG